MDEVERIAKEVNDRSRSYGIALTSCTVPSAGKPTFDLGEDEIEVGIGIHGEPGRERRPLVTADELAAELVEPILADLDFSGEPVFAMLNGMGATPMIELYLAYGEVAKILEAKGIKVARCLVGNYITSLDMAGCSLTLTQGSEELLKLWDAPVNTTGLRWGC